MPHPPVADGETASHLEGSCSYALLRSCGQPTRGGPSAWGWTSC